MAKNSFVLRTNYQPIVAKLSDSQAGILFKAILSYVAEDGKTEGLKDGIVAMAFSFIKQDIDYDIEKYAELCAKRSESGKKGGRPAEKQKKQLLSEKPKGFFEKHNDSDSVSDSDVVSDSVSDNKLLTADSAAENAQAVAKTSKRQQLSEFAKLVAEDFEDLENEEQYRIWFKTNCGKLSDILNFCNGDKEIALETINVCVERLEKANLKGSYSAVLRNISTYKAEADKKIAAWREDMNAEKANNS